MDSHDITFKTVDGPPSKHNTAGTMFQEVYETAIPPEPVILPTSSRKEFTKKKKDPYVPLPPYHLSKKDRIGPVVEIDPEDNSKVMNAEAYVGGLKCYSLWLFCRKACNRMKQIVPVFGGFISLSLEP